MMCNRSYSALSVATDIATIEDTLTKHVSGIQKRKYWFHGYLKIQYWFFSLKGPSILNRTKIFVSVGG